MKPNERKCKKCNKVFPVSHKWKEFEYCPKCFKAKTRQSNTSKERVRQWADHVVGELNPEEY